MSFRHLILISFYFLVAEFGGLSATNSTGVVLNTRNLWSYTLVDSVQCKLDVQKYCTKTGPPRLANFKVLRCLDDLDNAVNLISKDCQNLIYQYKYNLTHDIYFDDAAKRYCKDDLKHLSECNQLTNQHRVGHLVSCLYDALPNITASDCRSFIHQIQVITFTDWRLSEYFADACLSDIQRYKCGRFDDENNTLPHEQGSVLACLASHSPKLVGNCSKEISRMIEMQSTDFHLDRSFYTACRGDRERLCPNVAAGNGRVYRCLYEQKFNSLMSLACRQQIDRRQKSVVTNVLIDAPLLRACKTESVEHHCLPSKASPNQTLPLLDFFLCLEDQMRHDKNFNEVCKNEMLVHRRMLMTDYNLSPEILSQCRRDMIASCSKYAQQNAKEGLQKGGGKMIHCLLNTARVTRNITSGCRGAISRLVVAVNPGTDIRADPVLEQTCQPVINVLCSTVKPGEGQIVSCLLENLRHSRMTEDCQDRLLDLAYFMHRDWRITPNLAQSCHKNLVDYCLFPRNWTMAGLLSEYKLGRYLACLNDNRAKLDRGCQDAFKRLIAIRSQSVGLMPEIEESCINDLATCEDSKGRGEEMKCLQEKYYNLETECKEAVRTHTKITMADPTLDFYMMKACEPIIQSSCSAADSERENSVLQCLIKQRNNPKMDYRCRTSINHHQITSLKDRAFLSSQFQDRCRNEIQEHCLDKKTKAEVIQCLADYAIIDVLEKKDQIAKACEDELRFELLQRGESIELDPLLFKACDVDIKRLCPTVQPGNAQVIECLNKNLLNTTGQCRVRLLKRGKLNVAMPSSDYSLLSKCNVPIQKFCSNDKQNVLRCLIQQLKTEKFASECQQIVYQRVMILNTDARFNKALIENCETDIQKYCKDSVVHDPVEDENEEDYERPVAPDDLKDSDLGGRVIGCLRDKYANSGNELNSKCITELVDVIEVSKMDVRFDIQLYRNCRGIIRAVCPGEDKEDCLRLLYQRNQISDVGCKQEVIRIIREGQADVHVDHALAFACQADVNKFCRDTPIGSGRQLLCLLKNKGSASDQCKSILLKREELWRMVPDVENLNDLSWHVTHSDKRQYLFTIIGVLLLAFFLCGCVCRPWVRRNRVSKYQ